jgi:DNA processing protein
MNELFIAALSYNIYIGPKRFLKLREQFPDLKSYFGLSIDEQMRSIGIKTEKAVPFFADMLKEGEKILEACRQKGIKLIGIDDPGYPEKLRNIPEAPFVIYMIGDFNHSIPLLAIVGTRKASPSAIEINRHFATEIVSYNIGVVSGMAKGHDSIAQNAVLDNNGYTVAVLGCGIDVIYPKENRGLYQRIAEKGAIISEYPPGTDPDKWRFPLRNRIISGISSAVFLVQAPERSGALITGKYAEEQGRDLFVIPGNPMDTNYAGTNRLLQNGAMVAVKPEDIVLDITGKIPKKKKSIDKVLPELSEKERLVVQALDDDIYIDDLSIKTGLSIIELNQLLTRLELMDVIVQYPGRFFARA